MSTPLQGNEPIGDPRDLADRARRGDKLAFQRLLQRFDPGLKRILLRRTGGDAATADELAHDTWIAVWLALRTGRYDPQKAAISTFVYGVAHKRWLQHLRRAGRQAASAGELGRALESCGGATGNPTAALELAETLEALRACLHAADSPFALTSDERQIVFGLAAGQTERILASEQGVAASTIHARKQLAFKKLRSCMQAKGFSEAVIERLQGQRE